MADEKTTEMNLDIKPGMTVKVHEKIKEKNAKGVEKERIVEVGRSEKLEIHTQVTGNNS